MNEKKIRFIMLFGLTLFLCVGSVFMNPNLNNTKLEDNQGEIPNNTESPESSAITLLTGTGSNIGIYGYSSGTKSGTFYNLPSNWQADMRNTSCVRTVGDIAMPLPDDTRWNVKAVQATANNIKDYHQFISEKTLVSGWSVKNGTNSVPFQISGNQGDNLVENGRITTLNMAGNSYFSTQVGAAFDLNSFQLTSASGSTSDWNSPVPSGTNDATRSQGSSHWYIRSDQGGNFDYASISDSNFGYRDPYQADVQWWDDANFAHNGGTQPTMTGFEENQNYFVQDSGVVTAWTRLWTYGSIGSRSPGATLTTYTQTAYVAVNWNDYSYLNYNIEKNIPWVDDGSNPQQSLVSYTLTRLSYLSDNGYDWYNTPADKQSAASHQENMKAEVTVYLVDPDNVASTLGLYKFGRGPAYDSDPSYIRDDNARNYNQYVTLTTKSSSNPWKLRFSVKVEIQNYANFPNVASAGVGGTVGSYAAMCVESRVRSKFGVQISAVSSSVADERPWDDKIRNDNYVCVESQSIPFNNRIISGDRDPNIEFDWIVPKGIVGYQYPGVNEEVGLAYAQPYALIESTKNSVVYRKFILDTENFDIVRSRPRPSEYPWLGTASEWGVDHFNATASGLKGILDGADSFKVYVGFRFNKQFITDWVVGTQGNNTICLTNVSFAFMTQPKPQDIKLTLVWNQESQSDDPAFYLNGATAGSGSVYSTGNEITEYKNPSYNKQFYFRVDKYSLTCNFDWTITLYIEYEHWGVTTTYKVTSGGTARFEANFTLNIPTKTGFTIDYKNTWWFDIIFPKYRMVNPGEPYWDLYSAYEDSLPGHSVDVKTGLENITEALNAKGSKIAVYENDTDGDRYLNILHSTNEFPYHQFGRFHNELFDQWLVVGATILKWNVLFTAPNYVSNLQLSKKPDFSTADNNFYNGEYCRVNGIYAVNMNQQSPTDVGGVFVNWLYPNNTVIESTYIPSGAIVNKNNNSIINKHLMSIETPAGGYSAQFFYNDTNVCGDGKNNGIGDGYSSGLYRIGYRYAEYSAQRDSVVNPVTGIYVKSTGKASDGVPLIDTLKTHEPFDIIITWNDGVNGSPIYGANARITIDQWILESSMVKKSIPITEFNNINMKQMGNGSYIIHVDPEYKGHRVAPYGTANMTQGFHNFTVTLNKDGYDSKTIESNFSIIVDTILITTSPRHTLVEPAGYTNPVRPNYEDENAFAGREFSFVVKFYENITDVYDQNNIFVDDIGGFYDTKFNFTYQLVGWNDEDDTYPINDWKDGQIVNMTWVNTVSNNIINGTMVASSGGSEHVGTIQWPKFGDFSSTYSSGKYIAPKYLPDIHIYYNITAKIETNRTKYTRNTYWQPNDVRVQTCEDNPDDTTEPNEAIKYSREEIIGLTLHAENTGNVTFLALVNDQNGLDGNAFDMGMYDPDINGHGAMDNYEINNYWFNFTADKFRFRATLNCTNGAGVPGSPDSNKAPPVGPLNASNALYGIPYTYYGTTEITINGWNSSTIYMTEDITYPKWSCIVNVSQIPDNPFLAYGNTYVSPWIYYNQTDAGTKYVTIRSHKAGFVDDALTVIITTWNQNTTIYNNSQPSQYFTKQAGHKAQLTTPTGVKTSFIIQFNDTTPGNPMYGIEDATVSCIDDDWAGHFSSNEGTTWKWEELGNGRYNITLLDTALNVLTPTVKTLEFQVTKGNYTTALFNLDVTITPRQMKIVYLGGKDMGYYLPVYVDSNWTQLHHIRLTYAILDLSNKSAPIDFSSDIILNYFKFKQADGLTFYVTSVVKFVNSTGKINYNVTIKTNIDLALNVYTKSLTVNFSIYGVTNYYSTFATKGITINAVDTAIQMRLPVSGPQTARYLWNSSSDWLTNCPVYEFNVSDMVHNAFLGRNIPISLGDIILTSTWSNPNRNGEAAINFGTANEDIFYRTRSTIAGNGLSYQYLQIIVDHRGINTNYGGLAFSVTIKIKNYLDATVNLNLIIINATTSIENNRVEYAIYDSDDFPNSPSVTFGRFYSNISAPPSNVLTVPWGMTLAIKCGYKSGTLLIVSDTEHNDLVGLAIQGLSDTLLFPASVNPSMYEETGTGEFYFWFKASLRTEASTNRLFKILLWKANFNPAEYTINYTVRPRFTSIQNETSYTINTPWTDFATLSFKYSDVDTGDEGIYDGIINGTDEGFSGPIFDFGEELTASWNFIEQSVAGRYMIRVNTSLLEVREAPFVFYFNVTKLGDDGLVHWDSQLITFTVYVTPIPINIDHWFVKGTAEPVGLKNIENQPFGVALFLNPEEYTTMSIYLKVYTIINNEKHYLTDNSEVVVNMTLYDWNDELGLINASNKLVYKVFEYNGEIGYWVARIQMDFINGLDLIGQGFPDEVHLYGQNGIIINVTSPNPNYQDKSSQWLVGVMGSESIIPWWFWLMVGAVAITGGSMGLYGIRKALQLRIPFVLRMIDESIDKIEKDKFPSVGVMMGRSEYVINLVIEYLDLCGIEWETSEKYEVESTKSEESEGEQPPMNLNELKAELEKMENLTPDERLLFIDELRQLDRKAQIEFLKSLREENKV